MYQDTDSGNHKQLAPKSLPEAAAVDLGRPAAWTLRMRGSRPGGGDRSGPRLSPQLAPALSYLRVSLLSPPLPNALALWALRDPSIKGTCQETSGWGMLGRPGLEGSTGDRVWLWYSYLWKWVFLECDSVTWGAQRKVIAG